MAEHKIPSQNFKYLTGGNTLLYRMPNFHGDASACWLFIVKKRLPAAVGSKYSQTYGNSRTA